MLKQDEDRYHKKRFGQYFSGSRVAELLVSLLPDSAGIISIVDPMAGKGDLLRAAKSFLGACKTVLGVEIDREVVKRCRQDMPEIRVINKDAFCCKELVSPEGWDLVITNPPYVRYQLQVKDSTQMPSRESIKKNLIRQITSLKHLKGQDKELFIKLAQGYSGLSDMAVPSWILCAALVKEGGFLAMVVPDTWLSREYAAPIQYLLLKCFDILVIVRDINAVWFDDALIKTCLVVAKRRKTGILDQMKERTVRVLNISGELTDSSSLIGNLFYEKQKGFAALKKVLAVNENNSGQGYSVEMKKETELFPFMLSDVGKQNWVMTEDQKEGLNRNLPEEMKRLTKGNGRTEYISLEEAGIHCGQGFRSGANDFFYVEVEAENGSEVWIKRKAWQCGEGKIKIPSRYLVKSVQNRSEITGLRVEPGNIKRALLSVREEIRSWDYEICSPECRDAYGIMEKAVEEYINSAESHTNSQGQHFKDYSAVCPNEKKDPSGYRRFWYMLPPFTRRHLPDLCMNRVCSSVCECIYVPQSEDVPIVIDANFVTMWGEEQRNIYICLALLNSTWSRCSLELIGTVMGGGALKVEASHVKKLLFPRFSDSQADSLEDCGRRIADNSAVLPALLNEIDEIVFMSFEDGDKIRLEMKKLMELKLRERGKNK